MSAGIDYGRYPMANGRLPNRDEETGIRYGVIPSGEVEGWGDAAQPEYGDSACPKCGGDVTEFELRLRPHYRFSKRRAFLAWQGGDMYCAHCKRTRTEDACSPGSPDSWEVSEKDFYAFTGGEGGDIFVTLSPYYTRAAFCSPCAPGACYLTSPTEDGERAYCFGHEWFGGKAPYPVYDAATGVLLAPEEEESCS